MRNLLLFFHFAQWGFGPFLSGRGKEPLPTIQHYTLCEKVGCKKRGEREGNSKQVLHLLVISLMVLCAIPARTAATGCEKSFYQLEFLFVKRRYKIKQHFCLNLYYISLFGIIQRLCPDQGCKLSQGVKLSPPPPPPRHLQTLDQPPTQVSPPKPYYGVQNKKRTL